MHVPRSFQFAAPLFVLSTGGASPILAQAASRPAPLPSTSPSALQPPRTLSGGTFTDRENKKVRWEINDAHALLWNGVPYLPVGGTFTPRSLKDAGADAWAADQKRLSLFKEKGVLDLLIKPEGSLSHLPPAQLQRLVDFLDANGFRYGLAFGTGMETPLQSVVIKPNAYRQEVVEGATSQFNVSDSTRALYFVIDLTEKDYRILNSGMVEVKDNAAVVPVELPAGISRAVTLLYPTKTPSAGGDNALPDLWGGFDDYRDRLLAVLSQVKFGAGLRFFADPLAKSLSLAGEADYSVPLSDSFQLEFEAYLSRQYASFEDLKAGWDCLDIKLKSYADVARLIPLWANRRGAPYLFDPVSGVVTRVNDTNTSKWWDDFLQFRAESVQGYMNSISATLKKQVAEVPVVYTWTQTHPIFLNSDRENGFDGLAISTRAGEAGALARVLGPAYSLTEQSSRTSWAIVTQIEAGDRFGPSANGVQTASLKPKEEAGVTQNNLFYELDKVRRVGYKGFFGVDLSETPAPKTANAPLTLPDEGLVWLKSYGDKVALERNAARYAPNTLFFPNDKPGPARVGWVPGDSSTLWLNGLKGGDALDWWPTVSGYTLRQGANLQYVLTSLQGSRKINLVTPNAKGARVTYPNGAPASVKLITKSQIEVTLDERPLIVTLTGGTLFPAEACTDIYLQFNALFQIGKQQKLPSVETERPTLERTMFYIKRKNFESGYYQARSTVDELTYLTSPYIWLEGEAPFRNVHTLTEVATNPEASNGQYLRLSTPNAPGRLGYGARYNFNISEEGKYNLWMACSLPGPNTSPIRWRINSEPEQEPRETRIQGAPYLNERFGWILLGTAELKKGNNQNFTFYVVDRAQNGDYNFAVDAILITKKPFVPNGRVRPLPVDSQSLRAFKSIATGLGYSGRE